MRKKVSIVLPTYNGARYLRDSIHTCLKQTYPEIELVIVDDCSTDETPRLLQRYEDDPRVQVIRHTVNAKLPTALNTGFAHSTGAYLSWTSDDNLFALDAVERMVEYLEKYPDVGFVYTDYWLIDEHGQKIRRVSAGPPEHLRERCAIACFMYRREVYEVVGDYDPHLFRIEDYDYWLRVAKHFKLGWLPKRLYFYRRHSSSLTGEDQLKERARRFDQLHTRYFGPDLNRQTRVLSKYFIAEAFERHLRCDRWGVLRYAIQAIRRDASFLKNRGVLSIMLQAVLSRTMTDRLSGLARTLLSEHNGNE